MTNLKNSSYCALEIDQFTLTEKREVVYCSSTGDAKILPSELGNILSQCHSFKTLENHAAEITQKLNLSTAQVPEIKQKLSQLIGAGLLVSQEDFIEKLRRPTTPTESGVNITSVVFPTANRVEGLQRAISSYIENSKQAGRSPDFVVMDDSLQPQIQEDYKEMLSEVKKQYKVKICYGSLAEKQKFAQSLIKTGDLPADVVNFALFDVEKCGNTTGANRNALMLHTAGEAFFSADDDTVCKVASSLNLKAGLAFTADCDPADIWLFPDFQSACDTVNFAEQDIVGLHEQMLGKNISTLVSEVTETAEFDLSRVTPQFLQKLQAGDGKVLVTLNGLVGDCGWGAPFGYLRTPAGYLFLHGESHERITQSESFYRTACTWRNMVRSVNRPTISDDSVCQSAFIGFDNRDLLPPFMPVSRIQDNLFSVTLWQCFENAFLGNLPAVSIHQPVQKRNFWPGEIFRTASGLPLAMLMIETIRSCNFEPGTMDPKSKLRTLGKYLTELGSLPLSDFEEFVMLQVWHSQSYFISLMENRLKSTQESPAFWANDIKKYMDLLSKSLTREDYLIALDLMEGRTLEENRQLVKRLVLKFGQLLYWWPDIIATAKELRAKNQPLAREIF